MTMSKPADRARSAASTYQPLDLADLVVVHLVARLHPRVVADELGDAPRRHPALEVVGVRGAVPELGAGKGVVLVDLLAHEREVADVVVVPEPCADVPVILARRVDRAVLGVHAAQPPSAAIARKWAWVPGRSLPKLEQWGGL